MQILPSLSKSLFITILFTLSCIIGSSDASARQNEITYFTVVSDTPRELVIDVRYFYTGRDRDAAAYIGAQMAYREQVLGYSSYTPGRVLHGNGSTRVTLRMNERSAPQNLIPNQIYLTMYKEEGGGFLYSKFFPYVRAWKGYSPVPSQRRIIITATVDRPVVSRGQPTAITVHARDSQGRPLPHAMVTLSSGGGRYKRTGTTTVSGLTNTSGSFVGYWSCNPCARGYSSDVRVTKHGYPEAIAPWRVEIR